MSSPQGSDGATGAHLLEDGQYASDNKTARRPNERRRSGGVRDTQ